MFLAFLGLLFFALAIFLALAALVGLVTNSIESGIVAAIVLSLIAAGFAFLFYKAGDFLWRKGRRRPNIKRLRSRESLENLLAILHRRKRDHQPYYPPEVRTDAAFAIAEIARGDAVGDLQKIMTSRIHEDYAIKDRVCLALGMTEDPRAVRPIVSYMDTPEGRVGGKGEMALRVLGSPGVVQIMKELKLGQLWYQPATVGSLVRALEDITRQKPYEACYRLDECREAWLKWWNDNSSRYQESPQGRPEPSISRSNP